MKLPVMVGSLEHVLPFGLAEQPNRPFFKIGHHPWTAARTVCPNLDGAEKDGFHFCEGTAHFSRNFPCQVRAITKTVIEAITFPRPSIVIQVAFSFTYNYHNIETLMCRRHLSAESTISPPGNEIISDKCYLRNRTVDWRADSLPAKFRRSFV